MSERARFEPRELPQSYGNAICYSGYREGQSPRTGIYPSYEQIREDLRLLEDDWQFLRLYDASPHAETVLQVIRGEGLPFKVMLGLDTEAEVSNPNCPWGADFSAEQLAANRQTNADGLKKLVRLAQHFEDIVFAVSVGNESSVEWTDHLVPVDHLIAYARTLRAQISQPVTFCENYVPWSDKLEPLAAELDFLSLHTYPVWEYQTIDNALEYTKSNYYAVAHRYPDKTVLITEAGWTTASNGRGIEPFNASEDLQAEYCRQLLAWARSEHILTFVFEAFDEPWKGSEDPLEPEKHWGLFTVDRLPKRVVREALTGLSAQRAAA
ncbi:MAG: exo-beta-1,3-glucanase (GH17 family) [Halieaceae bacterium]|jgi:exo-beta-1,3-glucanase (GH17 family)